MQKNYADSYAFVIAEAKSGVEIINDGFCITFDSEHAFWPTAHEFNYDK